MGHYAKNTDKTHTLNDENREKLEAYSINKLNEYRLGGHPCPTTKPIRTPCNRNYEAHDFTGRIPAFDAGKYTPAQTAVYLKAKTFFSQAWVKLLPDIGNKHSMKNFSPDYPLNCPKDGDAAYIADAVT